MSLLQRTVRAEFAMATVLTIAHRLNTILDSDKVLVLGSGRLIEFGTPKALMANPTSVFREMVGAARHLD